MQNNLNGEKGRFDKFYATNAISKYKGFDGHHGQDTRDRQDRQVREEKTGQTDLTFKLEFPGNLCSAGFAILAMFLRSFFFSTFLRIPLKKE